MGRTVAVIFVLAVLCALAIAFAALYYAGIIPGSAGASPAATAASTTPLPILVILIALVARKRRLRREQR